MAGGDERARLAGDLTDDSRLAAEGVVAQRGDRGVGRLGCHDRDQPALAGELERVDPAVAHASRTEERIGTSVRSTLIPTSAAWTRSPSALTRPRLGSRR